MLSMGLLSSLCLCLQKKLKPANSAGADEADDEDVSTDIFFELNTLQIATNFFSEVNKLGNGGFGPVYKVRFICSGVMNLRRCFWEFGMFNIFVLFFLIFGSD